MMNGQTENGTSAASGGAFLLGMLTGAALGAGIGMLFAPKSGSELREQLANQAGAAADKAQEGYRRASDAASDGYRRASDVASKLADRGKTMFDQAKDSVAQGVGEAKRYAQDAEDMANDAADAARDASRG